VAEGRIWLLSGTGEGPLLARQLLQRGWQLRVSVVSNAAARAYANHPQLECCVGSLGDAASLRQALAAWPCRWVIDATHPFAQQISRSLDQVCPQLNQPLLRLIRPQLPLGGAKLLGGLEQLGSATSPEQPLLLAIGARALATALAHSRSSEPAARLLPNPENLRLALSLRLDPERIALLRPGGDGRLEEALCRRWRISSVLCRQSGGSTESLWRKVSESLGMQLLLLARPEDPAPGRCLALEELLLRVGASSKSAG
jgi:precorrin-6A/cobalt-precorrin-6A reductase